MEDLHGKYLKQLLQLDHVASILDSLSLHLGFEIISGPQGHLSCQIEDFGIEAPPSIHSGIQRLILGFKRPVPIVIEVAPMTTINTTKRRDSSSSSSSSSYSSPSRINLVDGMIHSDNFFDDDDESESESEGEFEEFFEEGGFGVVMRQVLRLDFDRGERYISAFDTRGEAGRRGRKSEADLAQLTQNQNHYFQESDEEEEGDDEDTDDNEEDENGVPKHQKFLSAESTIIDLSNMDENVDETSFPLLSKLQESSTNEQEGVFDFKHDSSGQMYREVLRCFVLSPSVDIIHNHNLRRAQEAESRSARKARRKHKNVMKDGSLLHVGMSTKKPPRVIRQRTSTMINLGRSESVITAPNFDPNVLFQKKQRSFHEETELERQRKKCFMSIFTPFPSLQCCVNVPIITVSTSLSPLLLFFSDLVEDSDSLVAYLPPGGMVDRRDIDFAKIVVERFGKYLLKDGSLQLGGTIQLKVHVSTPPPLPSYLNYDDLNNPSGEENDDEVYLSINIGNPLSPSSTTHSSPIHEGTFTFYSGLVVEFNANLMEVADDVRFVLSSMLSIYRNKVEEYNKDWYT